MTLFAKNDCAVVSVLFLCFGPHSSATARFFLSISFSTAHAPTGPFNSLCCAVPPRRQSKHLADANFLPEGTQTQIPPPQPQMMMKMCPGSAIVVPVLLLPLLATLATASGDQKGEGAMEMVEKRMFSYADLMNNFAGPSPMEFVAANSYLDEDRPKREDEGDEQFLSAWKRSPFARGFLNGPQRNYLMKKDNFVAPGVLRFGKRMPGVLRFGKRDRQQEKKAVPGVLRFGKRAEGAVPGVLRFGKRMPQVLRFG